MTKDGTVKIFTTMYKNDKNGTEIFTTMYKGGQYTYLQPCTHSRSGRNIRGKNGSKRQISLKNAI